MSFVYGAVTFFGRPFHGRSTRQITFYELAKINLEISTLQPHSRLRANGLGFSLFARHYWGNQIFFIFLRLLGCFSSAGKLALLRSSARRWFSATGFPIRTSSDQRLLSASPRLIAATPRPSSPFGVKASTIRP